MFAPREREHIERKALEQALRLAELARIHHEPLLPVVSEWPFVLTAQDEAFLRVNKIDPR
jgi:hypothetical protein